MIIVMTLIISSIILIFELIIFYMMQLEGIYIIDINTLIEISASIIFFYLYLYILVLIINLYSNFR